MAKIKEREKAQQMRIDGVSIADIATKLQVSKSTVSLWCRDIVLSQAAFQKIVSTSRSKSTEAILQYTEGLRIKRQLAVLADMAVGVKRMGKVTERDIFCIGIGLYWGEGYKQGNQEFGFTNSDPGMIRFYIIWLQTVFGIDKADLILRVSINESHKSRITQVEEFWVRVTKIPLEQFTKTSFIKSASRKVYKNSESHFGTLRIKVRKGTTYRRMILGMLDSLRNL